MFHRLVPLLAILLAATGALAQPDLPLVGGVPLPPDLNAPSAAARSGPEAFLGAWAGRWGRDLRHVLVVESVDAEGRAQVVYAVSALPSRRIWAGWQRIAGRVQDDALVVDNGRFTATYRLAAPDRLRAAWVDTAGATSSGRLQRIEPSALPGPPQPAAGPATPPERLALPVHLPGEEGQIRLEVLLYRPAGAGPHPLAVVNHGSTGTGRDPARFGQTWTSPGLARFLVDRGYAVAFPQRRGRGRSEGLYDEGFEPDRSAGYACTADRALAGADRALADLDAVIDALARRPDLDASRILLAGQSRGGVLSVAYAGLHPARVAGVLNFVGGWVGEGCSFATEVNETLFRRGAAFGRPILSLYGVADSYYSIEHSRANLAAFGRAGGVGTLVERDVPFDGHRLISHPELWSGPVGDYLAALAPARRP